MRQIILSVFYGIFTLSTFAEVSYFDTPSDQEIDPAIIPPKFEKGLVARVGKGGVTQDEFEKAQAAYANLMGLSQSEGGFSSVAVKLNAQQKSNALYQAIDDELLFQGAIEKGASATNEWKEKIRKEYYEALSTTPHIPSDDPNAGIQFQSTRASEITEFTEERIKAYYQAHSKEFMAPAKLKVKWTNWPANDEDGSGVSVFRRARENPNTFDEWQGEETVTEGHIPICIRDGTDSAELAKLYKTGKGAISETIRGNVYNYIFWVLDREGSAGVKPLQEVRQKVLQRLVQTRALAFNKIFKADPNRFYRMALNEGIHRKLKEQIGFQLWANKGLEREKVLEELRQKHNVEILLTEPVFKQDKRKESRQDFMSAEEKSMEQIMKSQARGREPGENGAPSVESATTDWKELASWIIWPVALLFGGAFALWKFRSS